MSSDFIIPFSILLAGFSLIWLRVLYYKRKNAHLELRLKIAEAITEVITKLKKNSELTEMHKVFLSFLLENYESKRIVRDFLLVSLFMDLEGADKKKIKMSLDAMVKESDTVALVVLCVLHASTYNFFLGGFFREIMFSDVMQSSKLEKAAAERKDFVKRLDVLSVFGNMPKVA